MGDIAALLLNILDSLTSGGDPPTFTRIVGSSIWEADYPCFSGGFIVVHLPFFAPFCVILVAFYLLFPLLFTFAKVFDSSKLACAFQRFDFDLPKGVLFYLDAGLSCLICTFCNRAKPLCSTSTERLCGYFISSFRFFNSAIGLKVWLGPVFVARLEGSLAT